jgi:hypothetical protein
MTVRRSPNRGRAGTAALGATLLVGIVGACGSLPDPMAGSGPCTLQVQSEDADGVRHVLMPPFVVSLSHRKGPLLVLIGQGWAHVRLTATDPAGTVRQDDVVRGEELAIRGKKWAPDTEGAWRLRLADSVNGCVREFSIEARAAGQ